MFGNALNTITLTQIIERIGNLIWLYECWNIKDKINTVKPVHAVTCIKRSLFLVLSYELNLFLRGHLP
jgi:hypothetical protein